MIANLHVPDKVAIGIPNPGTPEILEILANGPANSFFASYSNSAPGFNLRLAQARGTVAAPAKVEIGDYIFEVEGFSWDGVQFQEGSEIKCVVDAATTSGQNPATRLEFWTNANNATPTAKVIIDSKGKLTTFATANGSAGFNLPHGVVPAAPVDGDMWTTSAGGLFGRINGVTQNYAPLASPTFTGTVNAAALTITADFSISNLNAQVLNPINSGGLNKGNLVVSSASAAGSGSGAYIRMYGQAAAGTPGDFDLVTGTSGTFRIYTASILAFSVNPSQQIAFAATTDSTSIGTGGAIFSGGIGIAKRLTLDGATGKTLRIVNAVANAAVAVTLGLGPTGSTAGTPQGWMRVDINGTDRYMPFW